MIHYELKAVLSEYAGNHERELTAWVFGAKSEYMPGGLPDDFPGIRPHAEAMVWAFNIDGAEGKLQMFAHEEYGMVWQTVGDDQEWIQEQWKKDPETNWYGHEVIWQFSEAPTDEEWQALVDVMSKGYQPPRMSWEKQDPALVSVLKLSLIEVKTTYTVTDVWTP